VGGYTRAVLGRPTQTLKPQAPTCVHHLGHVLARSASKPQATEGGEGEERGEGGGGSPAFIILVTICRAIMSRCWFSELSSSLPNTTCGSVEDELGFSTFITTFERLHQNRLHSPRFELKAHLLCRPPRQRHPPAAARPGATWVHTPPRARYLSPPSTVTHYGGRVRAASVRGPLGHRIIVSTASRTRNHFGTSECQTNTETALSVNRTARHQLFVFYSLNSPRSLSPPSTGTPGKHETDTETAEIPSPPHRAPAGPHGTSCSSIIFVRSHLLGRPPRQRHQQLLVQVPLRPHAGAVPPDVGLRGHERYSGCVRRRGGGGGVGGGGR
jgi:hypothetical protein